MGPAFQGDTLQLEGVLAAMKIQFADPWTHVDSQAALRLWHNYVLRKRSGAVPKRPLADILIAAFALRFQGIITRNQADFSAIAPTLNIDTP